MDEQDPSQPLGSRVVNHMVNIIETSSAIKHHQLFFDNFFTSYELMKSLAERQMRAAGTLWLAVQY
jgi:Transposase IS4